MHEEIRVKRADPVGYYTMPTEEQMGLDLQSEPGRGQKVHACGWRVEGPFSKRKTISIKNHNNGGSTSENHVAPLSFDLIPCMLCQ